MSFLRPYADYLYSFLRIVAGLLFFCHGAQKLFGVLGGRMAPFGSMQYMAGVIEVVAGLLIMAGILASVAAFIASGEMAVAYFMSHFPQAFWPVQNRGEPAVLFCFIFLYIAARGSGRFSLTKL